VGASRIVEGGWGGGGPTSTTGGVGGGRLPEADGETAGEREAVGRCEAGPNQRQRGRDVLRPN
jgi:hypothetical protein